jgi:HD-GYP domain-containing protein (c-di-GMP phosphodiesterase class II)
MKYRLNPCDDNNEPTDPAPIRLIRFYSTLNYRQGDDVAKVQLDYQHVKLGQPLPFNLFDAHGLVWLKNGYLLKSKSQLDRLIERGVFFDEIINDEPLQKEEQNTASVYSRASELAVEFEGMFDREVVDYKEALGIAERIQALCELDGDAALANIQLHRVGRYSLRHSFHAAVMTEMLLKGLERPREVRLYAVVGALTMNICMLELQDALFRQNNPLTPDQKRIIVMHPQMAVQALRGQGIDHSVWLDVVEHHHEMIDGTGYAKRLRENDLSVESQVLSVADRYCAMVSEREYRPGILPSLAAKDLLERQSATISRTLAAAFQRDIGSYPPGTLVALANGEVAAVVKRLLNSAHPLVRSIRSPSGIRYDEPPKRSAGSPIYAIKEAVRADTIKEFDWASLWFEVNLDGQGDKGSGTGHAKQ